MKTVTIVGAIASATVVTLYLDDGQEMNLDVKNYRTKYLMDEITPKLVKERSVQVDLDKFSAEGEIERKTNGIIRFFKNKFEALTALFKNEQKQEESAAARTAHHLSYGASSETDYRPVAVIDKKIIPAVDHLEPYLEHAAKTGNTVGLENFFKRCATVVDKRKHSVEELMNFMNRGDLPIADDGSIVAYKVLKTIGEDRTVFVDRHSRKVTQRVGSRVVMDESLVDDNRRTECSVGLHIARRGYLCGFGGNVITLVKVAPEDVIAVPHGEPDKMRAAAYHIVAELPERIHSTLRSNKPMTEDVECAQILADVIAGKHIGITEEVRILEAYGGRLQITQFDGGTQSKETPKTSGEARSLDSFSQRSNEPLVTVREINDKIAAIHASEPTVDPAPVRETPNERSARRKREKRAALKKDAIRAAAMSGNMAAAISAAASNEEPVKRAEESKPYTRESLVLDLYKKGMTFRAIEKELKICRKTIKKIIARHNA